jgi:hypothetical protein
MSANPNQGESTVLKSLSEEQKEALLGEILGDVVKLHGSVQDLSKIVIDTDERITARVVELREVSRDFAGQREAAFAAISVRSREVSQQAFKEDLGSSVRQLERLLSDVPNVLHTATSKRLGELMMVGLASAALSCLGSLVGFWMMVH